VTGGSSSPGRTRRMPETHNEERRRRSGREWEAPLEDQLQSVDLVDLLADMPEPERADEGEGGRVVRTDGGDAGPNATSGPRPLKQRRDPLAGIAFSALGRHDVVADLHAAMAIWRCVEADASDHTSRRRGDDGASKPWLLRRVGRELFESELCRDALLPSRPDTSAELPLDLSQVAAGHGAQQ
jgi:hypothetical protein